MVISKYSSIAMYKHFAFLGYRYKQALTKGSCNPEAG